MATKGDCLFHLEVTGEDVKISIEGGARDLAETIANAALHSEEVNMVLKIAMLMLAQHEMGVHEEEEKELVPPELTEPMKSVLKNFLGTVGEA